MSSNVWVISGDLRRIQIKVTPATYLTTVLGQACEKFSLDPAKYQLRHDKKTLDLTAPLRQLALPPGAKLNLTLRSTTPTALTVALALPQPEASLFPAGRIIAKYPSDLSLWQVLRQAESGPAAQGRSVNITARGVPVMEGQGKGQLMYEEPVVNVMGRELRGFETLAKSLGELGFGGGNVLMRLEFRRTGVPLVEALETVGTLFKMAAEEELQADREHAEKAAIESVPEPVTVALEAQPTPEESMSPPTSDIPAPAPAPEPTTADPAAPQMTIFAAPSSSTPLSATLPFTDNDYTPSIAQLKAHQASLTNQSHNKRLLSDAELAQQAAEKAAKLASISSVRTKVRFPDNTSAQWTWDTTATGAMLHKAIRGVMANPEWSFRLKLLPGKNVVQDDERTLIREYGLSGGVIVTLVWDEDVVQKAKGVPFLNGEARGLAREIEVKIPEGTVVQAEEVVKKEVPVVEKKKTGGPPKWFKMGKK